MTEKFEPEKFNINETYSRNDFISRMSAFLEDPTITDSLRISILGNIQWASRFSEDTQIGFSIEPDGRVVPNRIISEITFDIDPPSLLN